jgi:hypothetical protein
MTQPRRPRSKPATAAAGKTDGTDPHVVEIPGGGGPLKLQNADEVLQWNNAAKAYIDDYGLIRVNDLQLLGAILSQGLAMYRAQVDLADPEKAKGASVRIRDAAAEIRELEKSLGIDKKSREAGGQHTVNDYVSRLKRAAHLKGVHISERVKAYEALAMEARWKIRLLRNGDDEDRNYHGLSEKAIVDWLEGELARLEELDKTWAREKGAVFIGKL